MSDRHDDGGHRQGDSKHRKRAYFFQACSLLLFGIIILGACAQILDEVCVIDGRCPDSEYELYLSATVFLCLGAILSIVSYCCAENVIVKYVEIGLMFLGVLLYFCGAAENVDPDKPSSDAARVFSVSVGLCLVVLVTSIQILSEAFNLEKRRVPAMASAILFFGVLYPWHLLDQSSRSDAQNLVVAGCILLDVSCMAVMGVFWCMGEEVNRIMRGILCTCLIGFSIMMFGGLWQAYGVEYDDQTAISGEESLQLLLISPGIFCVLQSGALALDVLV